MRFASLGSGSEGNALLVQQGRTLVMLDNGFGLTETEARLARLGVTPADVTAIVVTHEHSDHIGGVARFSRKHGTRVWLTHGTARHVAPASLLSDAYAFIDPQSDFRIGDLLVRPYLVPHDASEPVQFVFSDGVARLGVLTDTGCSTAHIEASLSGVDALVLECNHDLDMLMAGPYPAGLKKRVSGRFGHLDNQSAAALLKKLDCTRLRHVVAAHLSKQNNRRELATGALADALGCGMDWIAVAEQDSGLDWRDVS
ncbi:MAG: MBL fold metallo-hydrolase [Betaproteobacteria bacterium]|nr:MBL fold metallo-hydrolase [Betaproteobacteria bacterium]